MINYKDAGYSGLIRGRSVNVVCESSIDKRALKFFEEATVYSTEDVKVVVDAKVEDVVSQNENEPTWFEFPQIIMRGDFNECYETQKFEGQEVNICGKFEFKSEENGLKNLKEALQMEEVLFDDGGLFGLIKGKKFMPLVLIAYSTILKPVERAKYLQSQISAFDLIFKGEKTPLTPEQLIEEVLTNKERSFVLKRAEDEKRSSETNIDAYRKKMTNELIRRNRAIKDIERISNDEFKVQLQKSEKIERYELVGDELIAYTKPLVMIATNGGRYLLGEMKITFNLETKKILFFNMNEHNKRKSVWDRYCNHPHVSQHGEGCLGNASEALANYSSSGQYDIMFDICVAYLESINLADSAGAYAMNWDKCDKDGNITSEGMIDMDKYYFKYGRKAEGDEIAGMLNVTCEICGEETRIHETRVEGVFIKEDGKYYHKSCKDRMRKCKHCSETFDKEELNENGVCKTCLEELYVKEHYGRMILKSEAYFCSECGEYFRKGDYNHEEFKCYGCSISSDDEDDENYDEEVVL